MARFLVRITGPVDGRYKAEVLGHPDIEFEGSSREDVELELTIAVIEAFGDDPYDPHSLVFV